jgi:hypothetical protein
LGREGLRPVAYQLVAPLSRELVRSDESNSGKQLCQLAKQVSDLIKKRNWEWRYICGIFPVCKSVWPQDGLIVRNFGHTGEHVKVLWDGRTSLKMILSLHPYHAS